MLCNVIPFPVPPTITCLSQLFDPPELAWPGSRTLGNTLNVPPHVVGAVNGLKLDYAAAHNGQEPPPDQDVVSNLTTEREHISSRLSSRLGADWMCTRSAQRIREF